MSVLLTKSDSFKGEYCCSVVRIGELTPIEGSDFLAKTDILGTQIVVRKDQVSEGQVMFYSGNETALNTKFLSVNNLFEIGCRVLNANADEVNAIMAEYDKNYRAEADALRSRAKDIKSKMNSLTANAAKYNKQINKLKKELEVVDQTQEERVSAINADISEKQEKADYATSKAMSLTVEYTNLKNKIEELVNAGKHIVDEAKTHCGFFNKYGRVRCITLKGEPSFGFVFGIEEMANFCPEVKELNLEDYIGEDFDTVNGELFVKAYVPPIKPQSEGKGRGEKRSKKLSRFDRLVEGEFAFHYDTAQLAKCMHMFSANDECVMSVKLHGTSAIFSKLHVREPKKIAFYKRVWNWLVDNTGLFRKTRFIDYNIVYGPVYSSRTVIKNRYINKEVTQGFYSKDVWTEYGDIIYPYLDEGMTVYGEICGYITGCQQMIQKHYDYGCQPGENFIMFYRISTIGEDGKKREWEVDEVYDWTVKLIERMKENNDENYKRVHPIDILYQGTLAELYPELDPTEHWNEECLKKMKADKEHFGMEELEPLCNNEVPREGFVLRKIGSELPSAWKLKSCAFAFKEALLIDAGEVDMEMLDNYGDIAQEEK